MKKGKITISNYRSIPYNNPLSIEIEEGITFILGVNNVGKSNFLKMFYEFRNVFNNHRLQIEQTNQFAINGNNYSQLVNQKAQSDKIYSINITCEN